MRDLATIASLTLAVRPQIDRVVVRDDLACGDTARAIAASHPTMRVDCVFSAETSAYRVAAQVAEEERRSPPTVATRRANRRGGQPFEMNAATTLVVLPRRLVDLGADTFAEYAARDPAVTTCPTAPVAMGRRRRALVFPVAMARHGLGVVGTLPIYRLGYTIDIPVHMAPFLAFGTAPAADDDGAAIVLDIDEAPHFADTPLVSLAHLQRIATRHDWRSSTRAPSRRPMRPFAARLDSGGPLRRAPFPSLSISDFEDARAALPICHPHRRETVVHAVYRDTFMFLVYEAKKAHI